MPLKRTLEADLAKLADLRDLSPETAAPEVAKALTNRSNLIVAKAATLALHHHLANLVSDLVATFPRFLENATVSDPGCWAKIALAKTLAAFQYQEPEFFLTGMRHIQLEGPGEDLPTLPQPSAVRAPWRSFSAANLIAIAYSFF